MKIQPTPINSLPHFWGRAGEGAIFEGVTLTYWLGYSLILLVGGGGLIVLLLYWRRAKKGGPGWENLLLSLLTLLVSLLAAELYFKVGFAQSDDLDVLARDNWRERYYTGTFNSLGYRDIEWREELVAGKIKVMVVGDSFVEGAGIKDPADRFPDQLGQKLGPAYVVFNVGRRGAYTSQEIYATLNYPYRPDILVWSYVINDIEEVAVKHGQHRPAKPEAPEVLAPVVNNSYAVNFVYWRLARLAMARQPDAGEAWLRAAHANPAIWQAHRQELLSIVAGAETRQIPLVVVVFPSLTNIEKTRFVTERMIDLFAEQGVPTIDVATLLADRPPASLIASPVDAHPSELVHRLIAEALYEQLIELGLVR
jgi:lysophospholipase L1-like esterase